MPDADRQVTDVAVSQTLDSEKTVDDRAIVRRVDVTCSDRHGACDSVANIVKAWIELRDGVNSSGAAIGYWRPRNHRSFVERLKNLSKQT